MNIGGYELSFIKTDITKYDNETGLTMKCSACMKDSGKIHKFELSIPANIVIDSFKQSFENTPIPIKFMPYRYDTCNHEWVNCNGVLWCKKCGSIDTASYSINTEGYVVRMHKIFSPNSAIMKIRGDDNNGSI